VKEKGHTLPQVAGHSGHNRQQKEIVLETRVRWRILRGGSQPKRNRRTECQGKKSIKKGISFGGSPGTVPESARPERKIHETYGEEKEILLKKRPLTSKAPVVICRLWPKGGAPLQKFGKQVNRL